MAKALSSTTPSCPGRSAGGSCWALRATTRTTAGRSSRGRPVHTLWSTTRTPLFERVRAGGAEITDELHDTDYGSRDFAIRDPEGTAGPSAPTVANHETANGSGSLPDVLSGSAPTAPERARGSTATPAGHA